MEGTQPLLKLKTQLRVTPCQPTLSAWTNKYVDDNLDTDVRHVKTISTFFKANSPWTQVFRLSQTQVKLLTISKSCWIVRRLLEKSVGRMSWLSVNCSWVSAIFVQSERFWSWMRRYLVRPKVLVIKNFHNLPSNCVKGLNKILACIR